MTARLESSRLTLEDGNLAAKYLARLGEPSWPSYARTAVITAVAQRRRGLSGLVIRRALYPILFASGSQLVVAEDVIVRGFGRIRLGRGVMIEQGVLLDAKTRQSVGISVGDRTSIRYGARLDTGYEGSITIGCGSMIAGELLGSGGISVGDGVLMAKGARVVSGNHVFDDPDAPIHAQGIDASPVTVGDDVWLAAGSLVLPGITIGDGAVVGGNAVVTKDVPAGAVVVGVPARIVRWRTEAEQGEGKCPRS